MMSKKTKSSLIDFARPSLTQIIIIVGFIGIICLSFGLIIAFAPANIGTSLYWVLSIFLILFSIFGLIFSVGLILRQTKNQSIENQNKEIEWKISPPEKQKNKIKREALEIASVMNIPETQLSELLSAYIVAEDLALRKVQIDMEKPLMRYVNVGNIPFDGVLIDKNVITCIETVFLVSPEIDQAKINKVLNKLTLAEKTAKKLHPDTKLKLLYVAVTQLDQIGDAKIRSTIVEKFSTTPTDVDIRLLDFGELQKTFAME
jgi:uncharacterized SAM-binding protein YcdF (DUF218 family)